MKLILFSIYFNKKKFDFSASISGAKIFFSVRRQFLNSEKFLFFAMGAF